MKIHFCDLCNESVPQGDLEAGRAFLRKGRVVCAKCDAIMTAREAGVAAGGAIGTGSPVGTAGGPFGQGAFPASGGHGPDVAAAAAGAGAAGARPGATPYAPPRARSGGGAGIAIGLFAILLTALVAGFFYDRSEQTRSEFQAELRSFSREARDDAARGERRGLDFANKLDVAITRIEGLLAEARNTLDAGLARSEGKAAETLAKVDAFQGDLAAMKESIGLIRRHESELVGLQQKFTQLSDELGALGGVLADMEQSQRNQAAVQPAAPAQAPWLGILPQLQSPNSGDRWTAVQQLGETGDPAVVDHLLALLSDGDIFVRMATARVLGDLGAPHATGALIDALEDAEAPVREAAYVALVQVSKRNLPFDPMADASERGKRVKAWRDWWAKAAEDGTAG